MMKSSLIRRFDRDEKSPARAIRVTNPFVKRKLVDKYKLDSPADIVELAITEEDGIFERGVYKFKTFGKGGLAIKVLRKTKPHADEYYEEIKNTHLAWQQDSALGPHILKVKLKSKKPDYDENSGLLFIEFEMAKETLAQRITKGNLYTEEQRTNDFRALVETINYLHRRGDEMGRNFHGDLKPDNIFVVEHRNENGQIVDCLKIGDIEETLGTIPYRDFSTTSWQAWEKGNLAPTEKKDDLMAIKMIFLELSYDFSFFEFCDKLLNRSFDEFTQFLKLNALERKHLIEKEVGKQKYYLGIPETKLLLEDNVEKFNRLFLQQNSTTDESQPGENWVSKKKSTAKSQGSSMSIGPILRNWKTYFMVFVWFFWAVIFQLFDLGIAMYLKWDTLYNCLNPLPIESILEITGYYVIISGIDGLILIVFRYLKSHKIFYNWLVAVNLILFAGLTLIYFLVIDILPVKKDDYFIKYQVYCKKQNTNIIVPGIKLSNLDLKYRLGYTDSLEPILTEKDTSSGSDALIVDKDTFHASLSYLSEDFFKANKSRLIQMVEETPFFVNPSLNREFVQYINDNRYSSAGDFITHVRNLGKFTQQKKVMNILLTDFVLKRSDKGETTWMFFKELFYTIKERQKRNDFSMSKLDMIVNIVYESN